MQTLYSAHCGEPLNSMSPITIAKKSDHGSVGEGYVIANVSSRLVHLSQENGKTHKNKTLCGKPFSMFFPGSCLVYFARGGSDTEATTGWTDGRLWEINSHNYMGELPKTGWTEGK